MRVFIAGATGAIGQSLIPILVRAGHEVTGTTRSADKAGRVRELGAEPVVMDGLDRDSVVAAVRDAEPDVIVHQMTALSDFRSPKRMDRAFTLTNELRTKGTDYLLEAARAAGVRRFVAQSNGSGVGNVLGGGPIKTEEDPLNPRPPAAMSQTLAAIGHVETAVPAGAVEGLVLRYGSFYGPGTGDAFPELIKARKMPIVGSGGGVWSFVHIEDAAAATAIAVERGLPGLYNIVDDEPAPVSQWLPELARCFGAKRPVRVPTWLGRLAAGKVGVMMLTQIRGSSNEKAKRELGWSPRYASWRSGFRAWADAPATPAGARQPPAPRRTT